ncbi:MAG TPA: hypothetical protein VF533_16395, partial [Solirubrobacteraceae bacterium]
DDDKTTTAAEPAATASATPAPEEAEPAGTPEPAGGSDSKPELIEFRQGKVIGGEKRLTFKQGDTARFAVASDVDDEVHVHGYDLMKDVTGGATAKFEFKADIEGIFEVELEGRGVQLAQLRVEP